MLEVKVNFLSLLIDITEVEEIKLLIADNSNIRNLLDQLAENFGAKFEELIFKTSHDLSKYVIITMNGKDIKLLEGLETKIQTNDEICFIPAIAGG